MFEIKHELKCPCCGDVVQAVYDQSNNSIVLRKPKSDKSGQDFHDKMRVVGHYKSVKGFDTIPTWDKLHMPRAMKAAKDLLKFLEPTSDPVGIAIEVIEDVSRDANRQGFSWTLETVVRRAPDWLIAKQKER